MSYGCEAGSYLRRIDFVYHSTLGLRVIRKKRKNCTEDPKVGDTVGSCITQL